MKEVRSSTLQRLWDEKMNRDKGRLLIARDAAVKAKPHTLQKRIRTNGNLVTVREFVTRGKLVNCIRGFVVRVYAAAFRGRARSDESKHRQQPRILRFQRRHFLHVVHNSIARILKIVDGLDLQEMRSALSGAKAARRFSRRSQQARGSTVFLAKRAIPGKRRTVLSEGVGEDRRDPLAREKQPSQTTVKKTHETPVPQADESGVKRAAELVDSIGGPSPKKQKSASPRDSPQSDTFSEHLRGGYTSCESNGDGDEEQQQQISDEVLAWREAYEGFIDCCRQDPDMSDAFSFTVLESNFEQMRPLLLQLERNEAIYSGKEDYISMDIRTSALRRDLEGAIDALRDARAARRPRPERAALRQAVRAARQALAAQRDTVRAAFEMYAGRWEVNYRLGFGTPDEAARECRSVRETYLLASEIAGFRQMCADLQMECPLDPDGADGADGADDTAHFMGSGEL